MRARMANSCEPARLPRPALINYGDREGVDRMLFPPLDHMARVCLASTVM